MSLACARACKRGEIDPANPANPAAHGFTCKNTGLKIVSKPRSRKGYNPQTPQVAVFAVFSRSAVPLNPASIVAGQMPFAGFAGFAGSLRAHAGHIRGVAGLRLLPPYGTRRRQA